MFSHTMPLYAKKGPYTTHAIYEASVASALSNLEVVGAIVN